MNELTFASFLRALFHFLLLSGCIFLIFFGGVFLDRVDGPIAGAIRTPGENLYADAVIKMEGGRDVVFPEIFVRWVSRGDRVEKRMFSFLYIIRFAERTNGTMEMEWDRTPSSNVFFSICIATLLIQLIAYRLKPGLVGGSAEQP